MTNGGHDDVSRLLRDHVDSLKELMGERFRRVDELLEEKLDNVDGRHGRLEESVDSIKAELFGPNGRDGHGTRLKLIEEYLKSIRRAQRVAGARFWAILLACFGAMASALLNMVF